MKMYAYVFVDVVADREREVGILRNLLYSIQHATRENQYINHLNTIFNQIILLRGKKKIGYNNKQYGMENVSKLQCKLYSKSNIMKYYYENTER